MSLDFKNNIDTNQENDEIFEKYPFLRDYEDIFENLTLDDIIGEGQYGVIIRGVGEKVYKIGKSTEYSLDLKQEYKNHLGFYLKLEELKEKGIRDIPSYFRIPEVSKNPIRIIGKYSKKPLFIYEMEFINGNNLLSFAIKNEILEKKSTEIDIFGKSDSDIEKEFLRFFPEKTIDDFRSGTYENNPETIKFEKMVQKGQEASFGTAHTSSLFKRFFPEHYNDCAQTLKILKKNKFVHKDLHAKNIMISSDENGDPIIYIIDFGDLPKDDKQIF